MAFIPVQDTVLVRLHMRTGEAALGGSISLHFHKPGFTLEDMEDLLADLETGFVTDLMGPLCDDYNAYRLEAYDLNAQDGLKVTREIDIDGGSEGTDTPLSPALSCVVTYRAAKRGKWNAGRNYVCGLTEQGADQVDIQQSIITDIVAAYTSLIDTPPSGWTWVVVSKMLDGVPREFGLIAPVVAALVRNARFGIQRRRAKRS